MGSKYSKKCEKMKRQNHYTSFVRINVEKNEYDKEEGEKTKKNNFFLNFEKEKKFLLRLCEVHWLICVYFHRAHLFSKLMQSVSQSVIQLFCFTLSF